MSIKEARKVFAGLPEDEANRLARILSEFNPKRHWKTKVIPTPNGLIVELEDTYLPPSQTGQYSKMMAGYVSPGYVPLELVARHPFSTVPGLHNNDRAGWLTVGQFNENMGHPGFYTYESIAQHQAISEYWRKKMGVEVGSGYDNMNITVSGVGVFKFPGLKYSSINSKYSGCFDSEEVRQIAYGTVMVARKMGEFLTPMEPEDHFFVSVEVGMTNHLIAIRRRGDLPFDKLPEYDVLTLGEQAIRLVGQRAGGRVSEAIKAVPDSMLAYELRYALETFVQVASVHEHNMRKEMGSLVAQLHETVQHGEVVSEHSAQRRLRSWLERALNDKQQFYEFIYGLVKYRRWGEESLREKVPSANEVHEIVDRLIEELVTFRVKFTHHSYGIEPLDRYYKRKGLNVG